MLAGRTGPDPAERFKKCVTFTLLRTCSDDDDDDDDDVTTMYKDIKIILGHSKRYKYRTKNSH